MASSTRREYICVESHQQQAFACESPQLKDPPTGAADHLWLRLFEYSMFTHFARSLIQRLVVLFLVSNISNDVVMIAHSEAW